MSTKLFKPKQFSAKSQCYYCGSIENISREHVPPKMMFADFNCDCLTVPACEKHNTEKSEEDRAIISAILMGAFQVLKNKNNLTNPSDHLTSNVIKEIGRFEPNFSQAKNMVDYAKLLINPPENLDIPMPYIHPTEKINEWVKKLSAGLIWSVLGYFESTIDWNNSTVWSRDLVKIQKPQPVEAIIPLLLQGNKKKSYYDSFPWYRGWSSYPRKYPDDIYRFQLCVTNGANNVIGFRHQFYNGSSEWYVWIEVPLPVKYALSSVVNLQ
jgi:hypothetical protein